MKWIPTPIGLSQLKFIPAHLTWPQAIAMLTFPVCATKNIINFVQLWKASKILVGVDLAERAQARKNEIMKSAKL